MYSLELSKYNENQSILKRIATARVHALETLTSPKSGSASKQQPSQRQVLAMVTNSTPSNSAYRYKRLNTDIENLVTGGEPEVTEYSQPKVLVSGLLTNCMQSARQTTAIASPNNFFGSNRNSIANLLNVRAPSTHKTDSNEIVNPINTTGEDDYKMLMEPQVPELVVHPPEKTKEQEVAVSDESEVDLKTKVSKENAQNQTLYKKIFDINMTESIKKHQAVSPKKLNDLTPANNNISLLLNNSELLGARGQTQTQSRQREQTQTEDHLVETRNEETYIRNSVQDRGPHAESSHTLRVKSFASKPVEKEELAKHNTCDLITTSGLFEVANYGSASGPRHTSKTIIMKRPSNLNQRYVDSR